MKKTTLLGALSATLIAAPVSHASINFVFTYSDPTGVGFNHATEGAARQAALNQAAGVVEALFVNYSGTINMTVNGANTDDNTLAAAGSNNNSALNSGFGNRGDVGRIILGGGDPDPSAPDGEVTWNFQDFQWELASDFQPGEFDFLSTASHELLHAVGFLSNVGQNGEDMTGSDAATQAIAGGIWGPFDQNVGNSAGRLINQVSMFEINGPGYASAVVGGTGSAPAANGLYFYGANAVAANGGNPVPLYTPTTYESGSSGSHLDDFYFNGTANPTRMMNAAANAGPSDRGISPMEIAMLRDIGYNNIVPEPSTGLLGLLSATFLLVRRRR